MTNRYEEVDESVDDILNNVQVNNFPELRNAFIKALFDTKRRSKGGVIVLGRIMKPNDFIRHFTKAEAASE